MKMVRRIARVLMPVAIGVTATTPLMASPAGTLTVKLSQGALAGKGAEGDVRVFKNIPYARPPIGELRWKPPVPASGWTGTRDAKEFGPSCIQPSSPKDSVYFDALPAMSEDCLSLNVWTPPKPRKAPVIVWIHGGGLLAGSSAATGTDGAKLARRGVVVVSINYRLGVLGFLAHPALSAESPHGASGNYGLLDQVEALRWIRANISKFGGDPTNVTIMGQSAGGLSVVHLMASPLARGLFHKAVAHSAYMISTPELKQARFGQPAAEQVGTLFAQAAKAQDIGALRAMDASALTMTALQAGMLPQATVDGWFQERQLVDTFDRGEQARVPLIAGFTGDEVTTIRALAPPAPASSAAYEAEIRSRYRDLADAFLKLYPADEVESSILAATRDGMYGWTAERLVRKHSPSSPAYLFLFDHHYPAADAARLGAFHGAELPFLFGAVGAGARLPPNWPRPDGTSDRQLSEAMITYWTSFARTGEPGGRGLPRWSAFGTNSDYIRFADGATPARNLAPGAYTLHEEVVRRRRTQGAQPWNVNIGIASPPIPVPSATETESPSNARP